MTQTDKTAQPTPGPILERWDLAEAEDTFRVIRSEGRLIAKVFTMFPDGAPNARLVAAAPRMLEALREAHLELRLLNVREDSKQKFNTPASLVIESLGALLRDLHGDPS